MAKTVQKNQFKPDHNALIKEAGGDCGCCHEWTNEYEDGCREASGTQCCWTSNAMVFIDHCRHCGLRRTRRYPECGVTYGFKIYSTYPTFEYSLPE